VGGATVNNFNGMLDEVMFFNTALTRDQAQALFTADSLGVCKPLAFDGVRALTNGSPLLNVSGQAGKNITLYSSSNLLNWTPLSTLPNPGGELQFTNSLLDGFTSQFFRAVATATNLVMIQPGTFTMGSPTNELDRFDNEGPQTAVTLTKGFFMGKYPVTQREYLAVMGKNPSNFNTNQGFGLDLNRPVESVSWNDATNYCTLRTQRERAAGLIPLNYVYRLPTEAELEYACRAGTSTRFSYGDDPGYASLTAYAWYNGNAGLMTDAVGLKLPNPWGFYDMHGNVFEWCQDFYALYPGGITIDPQGPATGSFRVSRGGSWLDFAQYCRSARRNGFSPDYSDSRFGFRVVLDPAQP
jgi:formylglycine-generating enzyme required for sulfatase activity